MPRNLWWPTLVALSLFAVLPVYGQSRPSPEPLSTAVELALDETEEGIISGILSRGALIYEYDQIAWHGTDAAFERIPEDRFGEMLGYLVEGSGAEKTITFYGGTATDPYAVFVGRMRGIDLISSEMFDRGERALSARQRHMVQARETAVEAIFASGLQPCQPGSFNTVVIPPAGDTDPVDVYVLSPQAVEGIFPFGGHYRFVVSSDGEIISQRRFTNSCLNLPAQDPQTVDGSETVGLMASHLLDNTPTEIHVWLSLWAQSRIFVMTTGNEQFWELTGNDVRKVDLPGLSGD